VRISSAEVLERRFPLAAALHTARGAVRERRGFVLRLASESGAVGLGEASPASWVGGESLGAARASLEMAIRTHPSYATAHENLGDIYAKMASQAYDKALQIDKANTPLQTKLNLIKDIFVGSARPPKLEGAKSEPAKVAVAAPVQKPPASVTQPQSAAPAPVATKPAPVVTKPAPAKSQVKPAATPSGNPEEVLSAVNMWARAWSDNDVGAYLAHYATDFKTPNGEPRASWEAQRKARIAKPRNIQVDVESPKVVFNDNGRVTVTFRQHYRSDALNITSNKTLVMVKSGDQWLIQIEKVGS